ncbi:MAG: TolC family protein [Chromatiales bacterium]|nr:TolC family protein [Chromatiales bacterium]
MHRTMVTALVLTLAACGTTSTRTDFAARAEKDAAAVTAWPATPSNQPVTYINRLVSSTELDPLLTEALQSNANLQQALLTLRVRQAQRRKTRGAQLPAADASMSGERVQDSNDSFSGTISVSWTVDLWSKLANDTAAADKDVAEQRALFHAARDTLAAEVMTIWLNIISQQHAVDIQQQRVGTLASNERFIVQRYRHGLGSLQDLDGARTSTASARATLTQQRETLSQLQQSLRTLLGRTDAEGLAIDDSYPEVAMPLADLPAQTLWRRPDLQAAYHVIEAADLRTSVAYKTLLPSLSLTAALQDIAEHPRAALMTDPVWSLLAQLTAPLYQGGQLRAAADIAELETAIAYQGFRDTLINAVTEVSNALGNEQALAKQLSHTEAALASAHNNLEQYRRGYRSGLVDILDLLSVQEQTYDLEDRRNTLRYQRLANRITLGLALGLGVDPGISGALPE